MTRFTSRLTGSFPQRIRSRGLAYQRRSAVVLQEASATVLRALVRGTEKYRVSAELLGGQLQLSCTCPFATGWGGPCKHMWAALLEAERHGHLAAVALAPRLHVVNASAKNNDKIYDDALGDEFDDDDELDHLEDRTPAGHYPRHQARQQPPARPPAPSADDELLLAHWRSARPVAAAMPLLSPERRYQYVIDVSRVMTSDGRMELTIAYVERRADGTWTNPRQHALDAMRIASVPDLADRRVLMLLLALPGAGFGWNPTLAPRLYLRQPHDGVLLPELCATGRAFLRTEKNSGQEPDLLRWDDGEPWQLALVATAAGRQYELRAELRRAETVMPLADPDLLLASGLLFHAGAAARLATDTPFSLITLFRRRPRLKLSAGKLDEFVRLVLESDRKLTLELPPERRWESVEMKPQPLLRLVPDERETWGKIPANLHFCYGDELLRGHDPRPRLVEEKARRICVRDRQAESKACDRLWVLGFAPLPPYRAREADIQITRKDFLPAVTALLTDGWRVEGANGRPYQAAGVLSLTLSSGVDWFELSGYAEFAGQRVPFPRLLDALKAKARFVPLGNGVMGIMPEEWLKKYATLAALGEADNDGIRYRRNQAAMLDALLSDDPVVACDDGFCRAREELRGFAGIKPLVEPGDFAGRLRDYQRLALGWFDFLRRFGFGGCLADDMGLGKTVMVLALFAARRADRVDLPTLVVAPKTLVENWRAEAERFDPGAKVLVHAGPWRDQDNRRFTKQHLLITTYDIMVRDIELFRKMEFDYVVLDEAPAVKNSATARSKAVRLLRGRHRLALSGTPIENHLGELWTLFEFLNPGLLGGAGVFRQLAAPAGAAPDEAARAVLARALRPFILRRTKAQVLKDLPPKTEQTVYCDMAPEQKKLYIELRDHYRESLLAKVDDRGLARSKILVLEALLRLRQAACHPALLDKKMVNAESTKFETLFPMLDEVLEEGHKALVFSQFTSLLALLRRRLDKRRIAYQYLDGQTSDRKTPVECFQHDARCRLFLISLKAGGLGLNLTAADYVFILDPWWNPAAEAQAVDRAHRIGQTRPVIAYRFIARETVEEKVLELQQNKKALADSIINADNSLIRTLTRADLELLMS